MEITSSLMSRSEGKVAVTYRDADSVEELGERKIMHVHAYCFCDGKLVIVYDPEKDYWSPPGGGIEPGEGVEEAVVREVFEESNMRVISQKLIGFQDISYSSGIITQTRSVCIVESLGPFVADPSGDVSEIRLINPADYKKYFDWKEIGGHIMGRAITLARKLQK